MISFGHTGTERGTKHGNRANINKNWDVTTSYVSGMCSAAVYSVNLCECTDILTVLMIIRDKTVLFVGGKEKLLIYVKWKMIILKFCDEVVTNNKPFVFAVV